MNSIIPNNKEKFNITIDNFFSVNTFVGLFYHCCGEMKDIKFCESLQFIIDTLKMF